MAENDRVEDDEELYRNVRRNWNPPHYTYKNGKLTIEPEAFWDTSSSKNPSVDRTNLLDNQPHRALLHDTNGIVSLIAGDVRTRTREDINKVSDSVCHTVNVVFCPTCERIAHAEIIINPEHFDSRSKQSKAFRYLQKALARLATDYATKNGWTLPPPQE